MPGRRACRCRGTRLGGTRPCGSQPRGSQLRRTRRAGRTCSIDGHGSGPALGPAGATGSQPTGGYTPAQLQTAYGLESLLASGTNGAGQTIAIIDPFGSPTIGHDLQVFDKEFGLSASLKIIQPEGKVSRLLPTKL